MPNTTKRGETKRAAKIARAHATPLPESDVKKKDSSRRPGYKAPARGIARFPVATGIFLAVIVGGIYLLYANHLGPFALPPKPTPKPVPPSACVASSVLKQITDTAPAPDKAAFDKITHSYPKAPDMSIDTKKHYCAGINTNRGLIVVELDPQLAPNTVNNFVFLAQHHFYDGLKFHRVVPKQIIQGGDPEGKGTGSPGYKFNDEPVKGDYTTGTIAMANSGANTNGSQFFIDTGDNTKAFDKKYNLFGHVVQGLDIAQKIQGPGDDPASKNVTPDVMNHVIVVPV